MAATATKKPNGDRGVQLTFPMNFQAAFNGGVGYFPSDFGQPLQLMTGKAFQSEFHEQKRLEANQSVMNGIQNKRSAERKLLTGPHNYHLPKPVLGQRRFANPSVGAVGFSSSRRDQMGSPWTTIETGNNMTGAGLRGGVVTSREGYDFYKTQLNNRIGELNNINAVAQGYSVPAGQSAATYDNTKVGPVSKVTLFVYIRALGDSIVEGDLSRFSFESLKEMIGMMGQFCPSATEDDMNDMMDECDTMLESLRAYEPDLAESKDKQQYAITLKMYLEKINTYLDEMLRNINLSERDKTTLSKSLFVSIFGKLMKKDLAGTIKDAARINTRFAQEAENVDDGGEDGEFDRPAPTREDEEQGNIQRQPFAGVNGDPERERHGARHGSMAQAPRGYFGEGGEEGPATVEDETAPVVAPLGDSGIDPNAQIPVANLSPVVDALKAAVDTAFGDLATPQEKMDFSLSQLVGLKFPAGPEQFIKEVEDVMEEKGYSREQISAALAVSDREIKDFFVNEAGFDLSQATNLSPAPIEPAVRIAPTPVAQPVATAPRGSAETDEQKLARLGLPPNREALRAYARSIAKVREIAKKVPAEYGSYSPRDGTALKNAVAQLVLLLRKVNPDY